MKKAIIYILSCLLSMNLLSLSIYAIEEEITLSELIAESNEISLVLEDEIGMSSTDLFEIMALPQKDATFYGTKDTNKKTFINKSIESYVNIYESLNLKPFKPSDYDLDEYNVAEAKQRVAYDVNPPLNEQEQLNRMNYIANLFEKEYYQEKYQDKIGKYYLYLYTSHWTENANFERGTAPNFDKIFANIISENDIEIFDSFYKRIKNGAVVDTFVNAGGVVKSIKDSGISKIVLLESLKSTKRLVSDKTRDYIDSYNDLGFDTTDIKDKTDKMKQLYLANYDSVENTEEMINLIHDEMNQFGIPGYTVEIYVDLIGSLKSEILFASMGMPLLGIGSFYFKVLADIYPAAVLANLYYTYHARQADRFAIYAGMFERP